MDKILFNGALSTAEIIRRKCSVCVVPTRKLKKVRYFLYPTLPDFRNSIAFKTVPRLRLCVLLKFKKRSLVEWQWQGQSKALGGKPGTVPLCPLHLTQTGLGSSPDLHGERPATDAWATARPAAGRTRWGPNEGRTQQRTGWWEYFRP